MTTTAITPDLMRELADSTAMDPVLVRTNDGAYEVRSAVDNTARVIATQGDLIDYCGGEITDALLGAAARSWTDDTAWDDATRGEQR